MTSKQANNHGFASGERPLALVTGGAKRLGRATAIELARSGCDVLVTYRSGHEQAIETIAMCVAAGASASRSGVIELAMDDGEQVAVQAEQLAKRLERLDVLVHNASSYERTELRTVSAQAALTAYSVNALAPLLLTSRLAGHLERSTLAGGGSVVAMGDIHALGEHGLPRSRDFSVYSMSKAALAEMVRSLARELAPKVRVNMVAPGVAAWPDEGHESDGPAQQAYLKNVPLGRAGTPEEAARVVRWLALEATYITGEIIRYDGGRNMV